MSKVRSVNTDYDSLMAVAKYLKSKIKETPTIGLVCGSGLGEIGEKLTDQTQIKYQDIPGFPTTSTVGHKGVLVFGTLGDKHIVCMQGRFHGYEGYDPAECTAPIRVMHLLGVRSLILTAAAGALNSDFKMGDMMIVTDHISFASLAGLSPLRGPNDDRFGPRFPVMQGTYSTDMGKVFRQAAVEAKLVDRIREGVYTMVGGPMFATTIESKFLRSTGADAIGMSVVWEATIAHHCGMKVLAVAAITDVLGDYSEKATLHNEVVEASKKIATDMVPLLEAVCRLC